MSVWSRCRQRRGTVSPRYNMAAGCWRIKFLSANTTVLCPCRFRCVHHSFKCCLQIAELIQVTFMQLLCLFLATKKRLTKGYTKMLPIILVNAPAVLLFSSCLSPSLVFIYLFILLWITTLRWNQNTYKVWSGPDLKLDVKSSCLKVKHAIIAQQDLPDTVRETTLDIFVVLHCILKPMQEYFPPWFVVSSCTLRVLSVLNG